MKKMNYINNFFNKIPDWLSSRLSIFIYLFLLFYLVIFALLCIIIPSWKDFMPSDNAQLIFGNYTNVISALGASIAAGSGVSVHKSSQISRRNHRELLDTIKKLNNRLDELNKSISDNKKI
ncbi:hypothetical protein ETU10_00180 [Apibacter muscae]|uniref:Uncharacterized protein n=2 Tax=Apibacter muscae TaxID=2509004 RepID=A0A563DKH4_9FLAO|nr:hypothetical protein ETU10_00180 [Apibacter muscae]TWP30715.1 hypothetical protein ETU09_01505 [Apibacter muscae]